MILLYVSDKWGGRGDESVRGLFIDLLINLLVCWFIGWLYGNTDSDRSSWRSAFCVLRPQFGRGMLKWNRTGWSWSWNRNWHWRDVDAGIGDAGPRSIKAAEKEDLTEEEGVMK